MVNQEQPACPVDPQAREAWLRAAAAQSPSAQPPPPHPAPETSQPPSSSSLLPGSCEPSTSDTPHSSTSVLGSAFARPKFTNTRTPQLSQERQVSSIPRFLTTKAGQDHDRDAKPADERASPNAHSENPITSGEGKWVYPSESQFHAALVRKHGAANAPSEETISNIIPIHNAVNERTWKEILDWERAAVAPAALGEPKEETKAATQEPGPQLVSFKGDSQKLTPRARFRGWIGYQAPFDRHDWIVRRASGEEVEYVIDFYAGKGMGGKSGPLSFYLDVRPKLNSWEGMRMRAAKYWGFE